MTDEPELPEITKEVVLAKSRTLSAQWTSERPQMTASYFWSPPIRYVWNQPVPPGLSLWQRIKRRIKILLGKFTMEDILAEILSAEITAEIDQEIIRSFTR